MDAIHSPPIMRATRADIDMLARFIKGYQAGPPQENMRGACWPTLKRSAFRRQRRQVADAADFSVSTLLLVIRVTAP